MTEDNSPQNDLIREFSLQVLQQRLFISGNGLFSIKLNLIGTVCDLCEPCCPMSRLDNIIIDISWSKCFNVLYYLQVAGATLTYLFVLIQFEISHKRLTQIVSLGNHTTHLIG